MSWAALSYAVRSSFKTHGDRALKVSTSSLDMAHILGFSVDPKHFEAGEFMTGKDRKVNFVFK